MKKRIQEKLKRTSEIKFEPKLMTQKLEEQYENQNNGEILEILLFFCLFVNSICIKRPVACRY